MKPKPYADLYALPENQRCRVIAELVKAGQRVAFFVDDDGGIKAARYIKKITNRCKVALEATQEKGPTPGVITVLIMLPEKAGN